MERSTGIMGTWPMKVIISIIGIIIATGMILVTVLVTRIIEEEGI